jgi:RES domain-containing protein
VSLSADWKATLDLAVRDAKPFKEEWIRSVEAQFGAPDDVISGEGTRSFGGRFASIGVRAVYASIDGETVTREVTRRKKRLGGKALISLKDYPRITYVIAFEMQQCVDFRGTDPVSDLGKVLAAALDEDDLGVSQEVGDYLISKNIQGAIFPSVTGYGANVVAYLNAKPAPHVNISNREDVEAAMEKLVKRLRKKGL